MKTTFRFVEIRQFKRREKMENEIWREEERKGRRHEEKTIEETN